MKFKFFCFILCLVLIFSLLPSTAYASENKIYVSFTNGSDSNSGIKSKPVQSIGRARSLMGEDDTIVLLSGVYNQKLVFVEKN